MSKSFKYVSDFSFPADCGFTGSAGKTSVKGYSRGGPMVKAAGGKVGANRPMQQAAVKPAPQQPNQPSPRMQPPGPQRPNQPSPRMQPPAPPPPQAAVKPAPQQPNQPIPQVLPKVEQQSPLTQVAQNAQPQRPNQPMPQVQAPMPQVQSPMPQMPREPWAGTPYAGTGGPGLDISPFVGRPSPMGGQMGDWGKNNPNSPRMPNDAPNPFYNGPPDGGQFGMGAYNSNSPLLPLRGDQQQNPFNVIGGLGGMFGPQRPPSNPANVLYANQASADAGKAQWDTYQENLARSQPFNPQQTQQPLQPPQPNQAQESPMGPVGALQQLQGQQAQPAPQQASLQPQTPPTLAPTAMKRGGGVKAPMKKADGGMIERESVRFIPMSDTAKFSKAIGRGSLPSMIRGVARDMALSGFEEEGRLALDEARAARASQLMEERAPPRARSQGLRSPRAEMARERALMGEDAAYKKGGMAMRKQYPTNRSEPLIKMAKGGAVPKSDMLFSKKEVNATNLLRDGKGAPMPHPKGSVNMARGGQAKVAKVMGEFKEGKLHSGSKSGPMVKNRKQAIAIGLSEARKAKK